MKKLILGTGLILSMAFTASCATLGAKEIKTEARLEYSQASQFSEAQLAQMLAPIALYPDSLLTHILIASTYPIEVVEADRWVTKNKKLSANQLSKKLENKDWEPSIKALVMFPNVLERLSDGLSWTQQLGDAFLQSEESVLQAIQNLRYQAEQAGNLDKMENVAITRENKNIIIQPIQKEVVYVPYYDTRHVYGNWHWSLNPPIYWDWGHHVSYSHRRPFGWHSGIHISWNYFFSDFHWSNRHVVVVSHKNTHRYRDKKHIVRSGYANRWVHKPHHRRGVSYSSKHVNKRYNSNRPVVRKTTKHYSSPKLYPHKKDYREHKNINRKIVKRSSNSNKAKMHRMSKHEALQKKFNTHKSLPKKNGAFSRSANKPVTNIDNKRNVYRKELARKPTNQSKTYGRNKTSVRQNATVSNKVQHRTTKPVFKQTQVIKRQTTVKTRSKPQKAQHKTMHRSSTHTNRQGQRSKRHER